MKIGALWSKQNKEGKTFLTGVINDISGDIRIVIFPNDKKTQPNQPDYNIVRSKPFDGQKGKQQEQQQNDVDVSGINF